MRVAGLQGHVLAKAGVVPQQLAPGDIYPALERGVIDAVEYIGPYDDEKLGFSKVAKYYYYPGWGEGGAVFHAFFNLDKWNELPKSYQSALQVASQAVTTMMLAHYDAKNPEAISRLVSNGTQLKSFSADIIDKLYKASHTVYDELSAKSPDFKTLKDAYFQFRRSQLQLSSGRRFLIRPDDAPVTTRQGGVKPGSLQRLEWLPAGICGARRCRPAPIRSPGHGPIHFGTDAGSLASIAGVARGPARGLTSSLCSRRRRSRRPVLR